MDSDNEINDGQEADTGVGQPPQGEVNVGDYEPMQPIVDVAEVLPLPNDEQLEPKYEMPKVQLLQQQHPELQQQDPEEPP